MTATAHDEDVDESLSDDYVVRVWKFLAHTVATLAVVHNETPRKILDNA